MKIRNITKADLPFIISQMGVEWVESNETIIDYSILYEDGDGNIKAIIFLNKSSLFEFFDGVIPLDMNVPKILEGDENHIAEDAELFKDNQYELIGWYPNNTEDNEVLKNLYNELQNHRCLFVWARCEDYEAFPFEASFYNLNDKVFVDIPYTD